MKTYEYPFTTEPLAVTKQVVGKLLERLKANPVFQKYNFNLVNDLTISFEAQSEDESRNVFGLLGHLFLKVGAEMGQTLAIH